MAQCGAGGSTNVLPATSTLQPLLYNGRAAAHMKMGEWEDAERDLLEAFNKDAKVGPQVIPGMRLLQG